MPSRAAYWLVGWTAMGLLVLSGIVLLCYLPAHGLYDIRGNLIGRDFVNAWMASHLLQEGRIAEAFSIDGYFAALRAVWGPGFPFHNWSYLPNILPFLWPLAALPYGWALAVWSLLGLAAYLLAARPKNWQGPALWPALLLATSPAALVNLLSGQNGFFTAALFIGGFQQLNRRPVLAGVLFGLLTIKPHLGLLIPFALLLLGRWRSFAAAALTALALAAFSFLLWGAQPWLDYAAQIAPYQQLLLHQFKGFYVAMMPGPFAGARIVGLPESAAIALHAAIAFASAILALRIVAREAASPRAVLALAIATLLITPYGYNYDLTAMAAAIALYAIAERPRARARLLLGALWVIPAAIYSLMFASLPLAPLLMFAALLYLARQSAHPAPGVEILPFAPERAPYFDRFNRAWISKFFWIEPFDEVLLSEPERIIIEPGGEIWFAAIDGRVIGAAALLKSEGGLFEFSKLGLDDGAKGRGIGRLLLRHCIDRARRRGAHTLRIFTHSSLQTATALYRAEGFVDTPIPDADRGRYARADTMLLLAL